MSQIYSATTRRPEKLKPTDNHDIPELTRIVAKNAFPNGSIMMTTGDELGVVFADEMFADLYPALGQPAFSPARLALVTVMYVNHTDKRSDHGFFSNEDEYVQQRQTPDGIGTTNTNTDE